jgi:hypothetical protein
MAYSTGVFDNYGDQADAEIARIIAGNSQAQAARQAVARGDAAVQAPPRVPAQARSAKQDPDA